MTHPDLFSSAYHLARATLMRAEAHAAQLAWRRRLYELEARIARQRREAREVQEAMGMANAMRGDQP